MIIINKILISILNQSTFCFYLQYRLLEYEQAQRQENNGEQNQCEDIRSQISQRVALQESMSHAVDSVGDGKNVRDALQPLREDLNGKEHSSKQLGCAHKQHVYGVSSLEDHDEAGR